MKVVIDSNVLMAGILKDGLVRSLLVRPVFEFYIPEAALREIEKHIEELSQKANLTPREILEVLEYLLDWVQVVKDKALMPFMERARELMEIDPSDAPFIAACFALETDGIWTFDKHFTKQSAVRVFTTSDLLGKNKRAAA